MTYARSRLLLGISSVGILVCLSTLTLVTGWTSVLARPEASTLDMRSYISILVELLGLIGFVFAIMFPFDFFGGYLLPTRYQRSNETFGQWLKKYFRSSVFQAVAYLIVGMLLIAAYRSFGLAGLGLCGLASISSTILFRNFKFSKGCDLTEEELIKLACVKSCLVSLNLQDQELVVLERHDRGFTGGIIGFSHSEKIVIPRSWLDFDSSVLATIIARRILAIRSGDYWRGLIGAGVWNLFGLLLVAWFLPFGIVDSHSLIQLICGFTLFSFASLLILPTLSRSASSRLDRMLYVMGFTKKQLENAASKIDQLQDDEPRRHALIEAIFHPIPSVENRMRDLDTSTLGAWQVARTMLFMSWGCMGLLARSVHCNVGRPDLWLMPPSD